MISGCLHPASVVQLDWTSALRKWLCTQTLNSPEVLQLVARLYKYISHVETSVLHCVTGSQQTYIVYVHSGQQFGGSVAEKRDSKHFDCSFVALKNGICGNNSAWMRTWLIWAIQSSLRISMCWWRYMWGFMVGMLTICGLSSIRLQADCWRKLIPGFVWLTLVVTIYCHCTCKLMQ